MPSPDLWVYAAVAASSYLMGSIPFGLVLARLAGYGDIRTIGSGNIGATNVLRTGNKGLALATLLLDGGKGAAVAILAGTQVGETAGLLAGAAALLGHCFPVWLGFKGGKGVATALGVLLAVGWPVGVIACGLWLLTALAFRYSSLAALVALGLSPAVAWLVAGDQHGLMALGLAILVFWRHRGNIQRLLNGSEPRIGSKAPAGTPAT